MSVILITIALLPIEYCITYLVAALFIWDQKRWDHITAALKMEMFSKNTPIRAAILKVIFSGNFFDK